MAERPPAPVVTEEPRASQALLAAILSIAADAIITVDDAQRIVHFNRGAEQIFGWTAAEAMGQPLGMLLPERFRAAHERDVRQFGAGEEIARRMGHRTEIYGLRRNGEEFPAEASIVKLDLPNGRRVYSAVLRDVTERHRQEAAQHFLIQATTALSELLDAEAVLAIVPRLAVTALGEWCALDTIGSAGVIRRHTAGSAELPGTERLDAWSARFPPHLDSPWPSIDVLRGGARVLVPRVGREWLEAHTEGPAELAAIAAAGPVSLLCVPLALRGEISGALTVVSLRPERPLAAVAMELAAEFARRAAIALERGRLYDAAQRATAARDEVLGVVSHDLRNPLHAIAMCAQVLRDAPPEAAAERRELATTIYEATHWANRLISDLLDVAMIQAGRLSIERRMVLLGPVVESALAVFEGRAAEKGVALRAELPPSLPALEMDPDRVLQVLANLVGNAVKFTGQGGTVTVRAEVHPSEVRVSVADTGAGIPPEHLPHLFDLYWQARRGAQQRGTGFGLAIAKGIVEAHGGRIDVESTPGRGSTFAFTLPRPGGPPRV